MSQEREYEQELVIRIKGFGNKDHQRKQAERVKRILETTLHCEVGVWRSVKKGKKFIPVLRRDSNAYVSQDEPG